VFEIPHGNVGLMICADRREAELVRRFCDNGAEFLICPSGGMFGPQSNDPILQARSRENKRHIVFVHPAEFLVTGPDGSILDRTILGDRLLIAKEEIGGDKDQNRVYYFDLPVRRAAAAKQAVTQDGPVQDRAVGAGYQELGWVDEDDVFLVLTQAGLEDRVITLGTEHPTGRAHQEIS